MIRAGNCLRKAGEGRGTAQAGRGSPARGHDPGATGRGRPRRNRCFGARAAGLPIAQAGDYDRGMPSPCNIDARGKRFRLVLGLALAAGGILLCLLWAIPTGGSAPAVATAVACLLSGAFLIYEAQTGWCALRAMGFRTRL